MRLRCLILVSVLAAAAVPAGAQTVRMADLDWAGGQAISHVLQQVLEERLGLEVVFVDFPSEEVMAALDAGELDVHADAWIPNLAEGFGRYVVKGSAESVLVNDWPYKGTQGLYVPGYVADEHGVKSVEDLKRPEVAALFDADGDGLGEFWPGAEGWTATAIHLAKARGYGFDAVFKPVIQPSAALRAELRQAYRDRRPLLFYAWTPEAIHATFDLRQLDEPRHRDVCWKPVRPADDPDWLAKSDVRCAFPKSVGHIAYSRKMAERLPWVARVLQQVELDDDMINGWITLMTDYEVPAEEMARLWVGENPEIVNRWLASR